MNQTTTTSIHTAVAELLDAWNRHDAARISSFYAADYQGIDLSGSDNVRGLEGARQLIQYYLDVFPDLTLTAEEMVLHENRAAVKIRVTGTQRGLVMNIPPSGRMIEIHGAVFLTFVEDKIQQASYLWDVAGFLRTIGLLPDL